MRAHGLHKFCDRMLNSVRVILHERLQNFKLGYNKGMPKRKWYDKDQNWTDIMVKLIDKQLLKRRIMRSLEGLVGGRKVKTDYRLLQRTNRRDLPKDISLVRLEVLRVILHSIHSDDENPTSANIKQALRQILTKVEVPHSNRVEFIATRSYLINTYKDMMKSQVHVTQVFRYSDTQCLP
ncbi:hypothetical protein Tco_0163762 [Tanacetum coccineum]